MADDNFGVNCSEGFHVGSLAYVTNFHPPRPDDPQSPRIVVTKQSPEDVVSVPSDSNCTKCRVVKYTVLREYTKELTSTIYRTIEPQGDSNERRLEPVTSSDGPALSDWDRPSPFDRHLN